MESCFPADPKEAIIKGFKKAEEAFMRQAYDSTANFLRDKSGSCAIVVLIVHDMCYVANVGDSRAVLSSDSGKVVNALSRDHKPGDDEEEARIKDAGGEIYFRTASNQIVMYDSQKINKNHQLNLAGPLRVLPGRLSVARTFGDPEAKIANLKGNPNVVIHTPDVKIFKIQKDHDFIVLGCDGIFDKLSNEEVVMCGWKAALDNRNHPSVKG
jgi:serine/threonine protein phosphatase PrpC